MENFHFSILFEPHPRAAAFNDLAANRDKQAFYSRPFDGSRCRILEDRN